jgi:flagellar hook assembly protein FlgD
VRSLLRDRLLPEGEYRTTWDGTDDAGEPAAAGVYFIRLSRRGESEVQPVTLLR